MSELFSIIGMQGKILLLSMVTNTGHIKGRS